jgi:hypothetical protein
MAPAPPDAPTVAEPLPSPPGAGTQPTPTAPPVDAAQSAALERRVAMLEQRLAETRRELDERERQRLSREDLDKLHWLRRFKVSGYLQPQLLWNWYDANASLNPQSAVVGPNASIGANAVTAKADGTTTNPDYFRLRRARLKTEFSPNDHARFVLEIDPTPTGGPTAGVGTIARTVEAVGIVKWPFDMTTEFAMGIFKVPFGYEVLQSDADRPFIERSWVEQNLFPGEFDTGLRAYSKLLDGKLDVQLAVVNGQVQGEKTFAVLPDLNRGKDLVGRVAYDLFGFATVAASGYYGYGQIVDGTLLRFKQFPRWAMNAELDVRYTLPFMRNVGQTRVFAEATKAQNLDRGTKYATLGMALPAFPADLVNGSVNDLDELGYWVRLEQDLGHCFTIGARYDYYTPNSSEGNNGRDTFGAVGVVHFTKALQWMVEYDHATDNVHLPRGQAPSKHIDTLSNVLQARF